MSQQVIYVDRFQLREGKLDEYRQYATEMAGLVEQNATSVLSFHYYIDEDGARGTAVFVFADADALDHYLNLASPRFQRGAGLLNAADIELLGRASDRASQLTTSYGGRLLTEVAGFSR